MGCKWGLLTYKNFRKTRVLVNLIMHTSLREMKLLDATVYRIFLILNVSSTTSLDLTSLWMDNLIWAIQMVSYQLPPQLGWKQGRYSLSVHGFYQGSIWISKNKVQVAWFMQKWEVKHFFFWLPSQGAGTHERPQLWRKKPALEK